MMRLLLLPGLRRFDDLALLLLRLGTGGFLIQGTWDNVSDPARMAEFVAFLGRFRFPAPEILAPLSVYAQFFAGLLLIAGLLTRWAALIMAFNFTVAILVVDRFSPEGVRGVWPSGALLLIALALAARGAGALAVDARLERGRAF